MEGRGGEERGGGGVSITNCKQVYNRARCWVCLCKERVLVTLVKVVGIYTNQPNIIVSRKAFWLCSFPYIHNNLFCLSCSGNHLPAIYSFT